MIIQNLKAVFMYYKEFLLQLKGPKTPLGKKYDSCITVSDINFNLLYKKKNQHIQNIEQVELFI